jgi:hypothetical protein
VAWSPKRIQLRESIEDSLESKKIKSTRSTLYDVVVHVFFDFCAYNDSVHVLTKTIMDPFLSYYYLEMDAAAHCFVNMYFDYCEMLRRQWQSDVEQMALTPEQLRQSFLRFEAQRQKALEEFKKDVQRGQNEKKMREYNTKIKNELGIDNLALYELFP